MLAIRLMQLFSESTNDFTKLTGILGLYFQIRDDYCNLCLQEVGKVLELFNIYNPHNFIKLKWLNLN